MSRTPLHPARDAADERALADLARPAAAPWFSRLRDSARARTVFSILAGLLLWEIVGRFIVTNPILFAPLSRVLATAWPLLSSGELLRDVGISLLEFALGFALALVLGVAAGVALALNRTCRELFDPWVNLFYSSPLVALMPFFILVFGIGIGSKIAIVTTVAVFPILFNTAGGIRSVDPHLLDVGHAFNCSRAQIFTRILLPAALPSIIVGLRLGIGRGLTGVAVGELFAAHAGLGYLITTAGQSFDTPTLLLGVLAFSLIGVALMAGLSRLERRLTHSRASQGSRR